MKDKDKIMSILNLEQTAIETFMENEAFRNRFSTFIKMKIVESGYNYESAIDFIGMVTDFVVKLVEKDTQRYVIKDDFNMLLQALFPPR